MQPAQLTTEQQFKLAIIKRDVDNLTLEQAKEHIIELVKQSMIKDDLIKNWKKNDHTAKLRSSNPTISPKPHT